ncbi:MAG: ribulose-phosphate 3-epimerase [Chloroflexi bacterium]|nr:ribulose-phosphate 3-epimerase [Chloroflexota bacterium]
MPDNPNIQIVPSILSADFSRLGDEVRAAEDAGAGRIHVDVMDGHFVPNIAVGPAVIRSIRPHTSVPIEAHLMIERPELYIDDFAQAGADYIIVHRETCPHLHRTIQQIHAAGAKAGAAINPATPLIELEEIIEYVDMVLVMTVNPGFGGQEFINSMLSKVHRLRSILIQRGLRCDIEVDGGIHEQTAPKVVEAGANLLVAGSAVYGTPDGVAAAMGRLFKSISDVAYQLDRPKATLL